MQLETFVGAELPYVLKQVRLALGEDAMLVSNRTLSGPDGEVVEVVAARGEEVEALRTVLDPGPWVARAARLRANGGARVGPYRVALVGSAGAGKTTAAVKVALQRPGPSSRVGLITLDTYRAGALDEIQTYAEIAGLPLEAAYSVEDAQAAIQRLRDQELVLVDTPGRGFGGGQKDWLDLLRAIDPDEVHLVVPAAYRAAAVLALKRALGVAPTHLLVSKLDETPADEALVELAEKVGLPSRWVSRGPELTGGLDAATPRILASLGVRASEPTPSARQSDSRTRLVG
jgi:flagellar biosynthesis protein FlhF